MLSTKVGLLALQVVFFSFHHAAHALGLDVTQAQSIKDVTSNIAYGMMSYYTGNNTGDVPGNNRPCLFLL